MSIGQTMPAGNAYRECCFRYREKQPLAPFFGSVPVRWASITQTVKKSIRTTGNASTLSGVRLLRNGDAIKPRPILPKVYRKQVLLL
jgi:hypothetical protein